MLIKLTKSYVLPVTLNAIVLNQYTMGVAIFLKHDKRSEGDMEQELGETNRRSYIRRWSRLKKIWYPVWCVTSWLMGMMSFLPLILGKKVLFVISFGLMALFQLWWRRQGKRVFWRCPRCGYDLASGDHEQSFFSIEIAYNEEIDNLRVCPKCGAELAK